jgi:hypothetical protein
MDMFKSYIECVDCEGIIWVCAKSLIIVYKVELKYINDFRSFDNSAYVTDTWIVMNQLSHLKPKTWRQYFYKTSQSFNFL